MNQVIISGNVVADAEVKRFDNGEVANFTLATNERGFTTQRGTVVPDSVEFHRVVLKGAHAKVAPWIKKGLKLIVVGKIKSRTYEDAAKVQHKVVEIIAASIEFCNGKPTSAAAPVEHAVAATPAVEVPEAAKAIANAFGGQWTATPPTSEPEEMPF